MPCSELMPSPFPPHSVGQNKSCGWPQPKWSKDISSAHCRWGRSSVQAPSDGPWVDSDPGKKRRIWSEGLVFIRFAVFIPSCSQTGFSPVVGRPPVFNYLHPFVRALLPALNIFLIPFPSLNTEHLSGLVQTLTSSVKSSLAISVYSDFFPLLKTYRHGSFWIYAVSHVAPHLKISRYLFIGIFSMGQKKILRHSDVLRRVLTNICFWTENCLVYSLF